MNDATPEEVRASIVPKSDQLNADDLLIGPITVTILKVSKGDREQPVIIDIEGHRPYKPCKSMRRVLITSFSDDPKQWIGKKMTLFCDPEVSWGGVKVGGIRISHLSGIDAPRTFLLTKTRGKKEEVIIHPILEKPTLTAQEQSYVDDTIKEIAQTDSKDALANLGEILAKKSPAIQDAVRPAYAKRKQELKEKESTDA